jgi:hypothetical protein
MTKLTVAALALLGLSVSASAKDTVFVVLADENAKTSAHYRRWCPSSR